MKLSTRLLVAFLSVAAIVVVIGVMGVYVIEKLAILSEDLANQEMPKLRANSALLRNITDINADANYLAYSVKASRRQKAYDSISEDTKVVREKLKEFDKYDKSRKGDEIWGQLKPLVEEWLGKIDSYLQNMKQFDEMKILDPDDLVERAYKYERDHLRYAQQLLDYIDGVTSSFSGKLDPRECELGKWISSFKPENDELKKLLGVLKKYHDAVHEGAKRVVDLMRSGDKSEAKRIYETEVLTNSEKTAEILREIRNLAREASSKKRAATKMLADLDDLKDQIEELSKELGKIIDDVATIKVESAAKEAKMATVTMMIGMGAGIAAALIIGILMSRSISRRIFRLLNMIEKFSDGDLTVEFDVRGKDEIAHMGRALSKMAESLREDISNIQDTSLKLSDFSASLDEFTTRQADSLSNMSEGVEKVASSAESSSAAVEEVNSGVEEVASSAQNLADMSQKLTNAANEMSSSADEGRRAVERVSELVEMVSQQTDEASNVVDYVAKRSQNIGEIVETINSIAEQTNLLALNAAIEAARAGEAGKGFAVVADEIRKLAEEGRKATENINQILSEIQQGVMNVKEAMRKVVESVEETSSQAEGAMSRFDSIMERIKEVLTMMENLAATAQEQSAAAEEMASAMNNAAQAVTEITERIGGMTERMKGLSKQSEDLSRRGSELREMAERLAKLVKKFKV